MCSSYKRFQAQIALPGFPVPRSRLITYSQYSHGGKLYHSPLALLLFFQLYMDLYGWMLLLLFCDCWLGGCAVQMGRRLLSDAHRASLVLFETGYWDMIIYFWAIWAVIAIIAISMARSKNTGKGKASSSSMERAVKKRKPDATQPMKKRKGK